MIHTYFLKNYNLWDVVVVGGALLLVAFVGLYTFRAFCAMVQPLWERKETE